MTKLKHRGIITLAELLSQYVAEPGFEFKKSKPVFFTTQDCFSQTAVLWIKR